MSKELCCIGGRVICMYHQLLAWRFEIDVVCEVRQAHEKKRQGESCLKTEAIVMSTAIDYCTIAKFLFLWFVNEILAVNSGAQKI